MANDDTNKKTTVMKDKKVILSTVWIVALFNYLYADVFSLAFNPEEWDVTILTEGAMLGFAVLMETAIAMVLLSRVTCPPKTGPHEMRDSCKISTGGNRENKKVFGGAGIPYSQGS
jgi:hypothetical protein